MLPRGLNPANTKDGAQKNIEAHYDLSNEMFQQFLDPTLSYSSALFDSLDAAAGAGRPRGGPAAKVDAILDSAGVTRGLPGARDRHRLGHARDPGRPARRDASPRVTLSVEQAELAQQRVDAAGVADRVEVARARLPRPGRARSTRSSASR